ncbi:uncharacterized protein LOC129572283 [Sitodiplosis mosellana]|uniref:uncharacterized protein LOC129572283 n=1 Tax=Sitodiplosis mosellana TaxID=263140 RepID=UPI002444F15C|nr:uncharacterized protein LOC129572283 [Sitodiplosis mosellana]
MFGDKEVVSSRDPPLWSKSAWTSAVASTSQAKQSYLPSSGITINLQQSSISSGTSEALNKKSDKCTPNRKKIRKSLIERHNDLKEELKKEKRIKADIKKELNDQLKEKVAELNQVKKENAKLKKTLDALSKGNGLEKKALEKKCKYLLEENEKLRKTLF